MVLPAIPARHAPALQYIVDGRCVPGDGVDVRHDGDSTYAYREGLRRCRAQREACNGGDGGSGGRGGYGGGGRGGDSIGIAHLDDTELVLENVTFELGELGKGGIGNPADPATWGEDGIAVETLRFSE
ncbi:hypothetical protein [Sorangium sp. So ce341]|uniref:hypothetical protein n=1 Tax=Sorangium sp. So ce341 TaxID=3133302 RepID=UPI003F614090